jgi:outer membrane protein assembly factor BamB
MSRPLSRRAVLAGGGGLAAAALAGSALADASLFADAALRNRAAVWRQRWGDPSLRNVAPVDLDPTALTELWSLSPSSSLYSTNRTVGVCLGPDSVSLGTGRAGVAALDRATGDTVWSRAAFQSPTNSVALVDDTLVVHTTDGVRTLRVATGEDRWRSRYTVTNTLPPVVHDGTLYGRPDTGDASAWREFGPKTGMQRRSVGNAERRLVAAHGDRLLWSDDGLVATDLAGEREWYAPVEGPSFPRGSELVATDAVVAVRHRVDETTDEVRAYDPADGTRRWTTERVRGATPLVTAGTDAVYVTAVADSGQDAVAAYDPATGDRRWRRQVAATTAPPLATNGHLYVPTEHGVAVRDAETGRAVGDPLGPAAHVQELAAVEGFLLAATAERLVAMEASA